MYEKRRVELNSVRRDASQGAGVDPTDEELLELYLALPNQQRNGKFANTARVAEITGLTQRTIQLWIQIGAVRAVRIGGKYQVDLDSLKEYLRCLAAERT